jgi:hypothetical protein
MIGIASQNIKYLGVYCAYTGLYYAYTGTYLA